MPTTQCHCRADERVRRALTDHVLPGWREIGRDRLTQAAALRAELVEEAVQDGAATTRLRPDDPARVVADDAEQVAAAPALVLQVRDEARLVSEVVIAFAKLPEVGHAVGEVHEFSALGRILV